MPATFYAEGGWQDINDSQRIMRRRLEKQILGSNLDLRNQKLWMGLGSLFSTRPPGDSDTRHYNLLVENFLWEYFNETLTIFSAPVVGEYHRILVSFYTESENEKLRGF